MLHRKRRPRSSRTAIAVHRRWWLDRFTLEEIIEMARAMWPLDAQRKAGLRASAESAGDSAGESATEPARLGVPLP
jgi:hypothetical protein